MKIAGSGSVSQMGRIRRRTKISRIRNTGLEHKFPERQFFFRALIQTKDLVFWTLGLNTILSLGEAPITFFSNHTSTIFMCNADAVQCTQYSTFLKLEWLTNYFYSINARSDLISCYFVPRSFFFCCTRREIWNFKKKSGFFTSWKLST